MTIFDEASLKRHVEESLGAMLPHQRGAIVAVASLDGTVELRYAHRFADGWKIGALLRKAPGESPEGGVRVEWSW